MKFKKGTYIEKINKEIEEGGQISWENFNNLKRYNKRTQEMDIFDMETFICFFKRLYDTKPLTGDALNRFKIDKNTHLELESIPNKEISETELTSSITKLKNGKAVAEDKISNEFIKNSSVEMQLALLKLFNECLNHGYYSRNTSIVTPIYKKGNIYDPNNYRAIAVGSSLGKLFSSIMLERLLQFRQEEAKNPPNQLGFCREAQTADHILTLDTCIQKYVKKNQSKLYTCFIDFQKTFDTVSREALIYKLFKLGVKRKFLAVLSHMYSHSKARIKLLSRLSEQIDILVGTEQGHPMSPELFKLYILDFSRRIKEIENTVTVPCLNELKLSHLLWADDLILLALNEKSLQILLNQLKDFCDNWGLVVNMTKTQVMVFNRSGRKLKESKTFKYGDLDIESTSEYTYLGITMSLTGTYNIAVANLQKKALRGYFALRSIVDWRFLKRSSIIKLFDSLIKPILTYGCQIWLPYLSKQEIHQLLPTTEDRNAKVNYLFSKSAYEKTHLAILKWILGVNKKTSNQAIRGDTGRVPISLTVVKQVLHYFNRVTATSEPEEMSIVQKAVKEQQALNLPWFATLREILNCNENQSKEVTTKYLSNEKPGKNIQVQLQRRFIELWETEFVSNKKLCFYNTIKDNFMEEKYLQLTQKRNQGKAADLAKLRMSAHRLQIEVGHYQHQPPEERVCHLCTTIDETTIEAFLQLPFLELVVETEEHFLQECPFYTDIRKSLPMNKWSQQNNLLLLLKNDASTLLAARFVSKLFGKREEGLNSLRTVLKAQ